jgi:hypothetical protein
MSGNFRGAGVGLIDREWLGIPATDKTFDTLDFMMVKVCYVLLCSVGFRYVLLYSVIMCSRGLMVD